MSKRGKFGALAGALLFTFAVASTAFAAKPGYSVSIDKTASPATVPAAGGSVTYTVAVTNDGTGFFLAVNVSDDLCTLSAPTGNPDDGDNKFEPGETWWYTCTVAGTHSGTTNTATVNACHDGSIDQCNNASHDATATDSVTIGLTPAAPAAGAPNTSTTATAASSSADGAWLLIIALGVLLASVVILTPARAKSRG